MKLHNYAILKESLRSAREKYLNTNQITKQTFNYFLKKDPSKTKKYLEWMCKAWINKKDRFIIKRDIADIIVLFEKAIKTKFNLPNKDLYAYKTYSELKEALTGFSTYMLVNSKQAKKAGAKLIWEDEDCYIYYIKTKEACLIYGANTKWCITQANKTYWEDYNSDNFFVFLISKLKPKEKYAFCIETTAFLNGRLKGVVFDEKDREAELDKVLYRFGFDFKNFSRILYDELEDDILKRENNFLAEYIDRMFEKNEDGTYNIIPNEKNKLNKYYTYLLPNKLLDSHGKLLIKFKRCECNFYCHPELTSLEGCPEEVTHNFSCSDTKITSLHGGPKKVNGHFNCSMTNILSLEGSPEEVKTGFYCNLCSNLLSLKGAPQTKMNFFSCNDCPKITTLEGCSPIVYKNFSCAGCEGLTTLQGAPKPVENEFGASRCKNLVTLEGLPTTVKILYISGDYNLESLEKLAEIKDLKKVYISRKNEKGLSIPEELKKYSNLKQPFTVYYNS